MSADTATGPNHSLFVQVLAQIEREPEKWEQGDWGPTTRACATAYCFAGWAAVLNGASQVFEEGNDDRVYAVFGRKREHVPEAACRLLGLEYDPNREEDTTRLFDGLNTLDDLYRISADILGIDEQVLREKVAAEVADGSVQP